VSVSPVNDVLARQDRDASRSKTVEDEQKESDEGTTVRTGVEGNRSVVSPRLNFVDKEVNTDHDKELEDGDDGLDNTCVEVQQGSRLKAHTFTNVVDVEVHVRQGVESEEGQENGKIGTKLVDCEKQGGGLDEEEEDLGNAIVRRTIISGSHEDEHDKYPVDDERDKQKPIIIEFARKTFGARGVVPLLTRTTQKTLTVVSAYSVIIRGNVVFGSAVVRRATNGEKCREVIRIVRVLNAVSRDSCCVGIHEIIFLGQSQTTFAFHTKKRAFSTLQHPDVSTSITL
jgi:hypothetical protein